MQKTVKTFTLLILAVLLLCSCSEKSGGSSNKGTYDISQYIDSFKKMDYAAMYNFTQPVVNIDQKTFVQKYTGIFKGLGVTAVDITDMEGPDEEGTYTFSVAYKTKDYGDFTSSFTLRTGFKDKQCVVLWDYSLIFPEMGEGSSVKVRTIKADRGEIFAMNGSVLAKNSFADTLYMDTTKVADISAVAEVACPLTGLTNDEIIDKFNNAVKNGYDIVALGSYLPGQLTAQQRQSILAVQGLGIDNEKYTPMRSYTLGEAAAHIIGYTGSVNKDSVPEGYDASDRIGKTGLESAYESELRGKDGIIVYIEDKWGKNVRTLFELPCEEGKDLRLTIDPVLQAEAYSALKSHLTGAQTGVAIVMDAKTGYVQAITSYPSYDDNIFNLPVPKAVMDQLNSADSHQPLFFRATQGIGYPPGSAIKPFTAAAALQGGAITKDTVFTGTIKNNLWMPDEAGWHWKAIKRKDAAAGPHPDLESALVHSDNIYFAFVAMKMGDEALTDYFTKIGFTEAVPFDRLNVSKANLINKDRKMDRRLLAEMGYGQGQILITPLQLAAMYTAFANGTGDMMKPMLVREICQTQGDEYKTLSDNESAVWKKGLVSGSTISLLTPMMEDVVNKGTATKSKIDGVRIAGKTGTAQIDEKREISWFAGFWLDGYYDRLVIVMVDAAPDEGSVKFDIAKELLSP